MAHYAYKDVVYEIPEHIRSQYPDLDPNYDGSAWYATRDWIDELQARINELEAIVDYFGCDVSVQGCQEAIKRATGG